MRIGWTACGLVWCLAIVADARDRRPTGSVTDMDRLARRQQPASSSAPTSASAPASSSSSSSNPNGQRSLPPAPASPPSSAPSPIPTPMDLTVSYSLSDDCLMFMTGFLTNTLFQSCLPLSLLLTTSTSYRQLVQSAPDDGYTTLNELISYTSTPQPSAQQCDDYFAGLTKSLGEKKHCATDLSRSEQDPTALDAQRGLGNYQVVREASALQDPQTGVYCYLQAVADSRPDDMYLWSLPAGIPLPRSSTPTCSPCSALLLNHLASATAPTLNTTLVLDAVNTVNAACGGSLVTYNNVSIANSAVPQSVSGMTPFTAFSLLAAVIVLVSPLAISF